MRAEWSLYRIEFDNRQQVFIVAPSITVAMADAVEVEAEYRLSNITRVEEEHHEVYMSPSILKGGSYGERSDRAV